MDLGVEKIYTNAVSSMAYSILGLPTAYGPLDMAWHSRTAFLKLVFFFWRFDFDIGAYILKERGSIISCVYVGAAHPRA